MEQHICLYSSKVVDVRSLKKGKIGLRRRRECLQCGERFTTREVLVETVLTEAEQIDHKKHLTDMVKKFKIQIEKFEDHIKEL